MKKEKAKLLIKELVKRIGLSKEEILNLIEEKARKPVVQEERSVSRQRSDGDLVRFLRKLDEPFALISSKKVVNDAIELGLVQEEQTAYYGNLKGSNKLKQYNRIVIIGAPHPGHEEIILDSAQFFGYDAQPQGRGKNLKYGSERRDWETILKHHREYKIHHAIHRIRPLLSEKTAVDMFTSCIPETIPVHHDETGDDPEDASAFIKRFLIQNPRTKTARIAESLGYSRQHIRRICGRMDGIVNRGSDGKKIWSVDVSYLTNIFNREVRKISETYDFDISIDEIPENAIQVQKSLRDFTEVVQNV